MYQYNKAWNNINRKFPELQSCFMTPEWIPEQSKGVHKGLVKHDYNDISMFSERDHIYFYQEMCFLYSVCCISI